MLDKVRHTAEQIPPAVVTELSERLVEMPSLSRAAVFSAAKVIDIARAEIKNERAKKKAENSDDKID